MMKDKKLFSRFKPSSLLDYWTVAAFLAAVLALFFLRGLDLGLLALFLVPPSVVFLWRHFSDRTSTRVMSAMFLTLIGAGVSLAKIDRVFPNLGGVDDGLSRTHDRILTWYVIIYLLYLFLALPILLFGRGLLDHRSKRNPQFSKFTCVLGLIACIIVGPAMVGVCGKVLGLFPVWDSRSERDAQQTPAGDVLKAAPEE